MPQDRNGGMIEIYIVVKVVWYSKLRLRIFIIEKDVLLGIVIIMRVVETSSLVHESLQCLPLPWLHD